MKHSRYYVFFTAWLVTGILLVLNRALEPDIRDIRALIENRLAARIESQDQVLEEIRQKFSSISQPYNISVDYAYGLQAYDNGELVYWNQNDYLPPYLDFRSTDSLYFFDGTSKYLIARETINYYETGLLEFYAFLPIYERYELNNEYLNTGLNEEVFGRFEVDFVESGEAVHYGDQKLFEIAFRFAEPGLIRQLLELSFLISLIITIYFFYNFILRRFALPWSFVFLFGLSTLHFSLLYFGVSLGQSTLLFDPKNYTASWWLPSLGELTIHLMILYLFSRLTFNYLLRNISFNKFILRSSWLKHVWLFFIIAVTLTCATYLFDLTWNLLENSLVILDISISVEFSWLRVYSYALILFMGVIFFHFNHVAFQYFLRIANNRTKKLIYLILVVPLYLSLAHQLGVIILLVFVLLWSILYISELTFQLSNVRYLTFYYYLLVAISVSILCSLAISQHHQRDEINRKQRFASSLLLENDILAEFYLNEVVQTINNDPNIRSRFYTQILARQNLKDRIMQSIPAYLNKYDIQLHVFDPNGIEFINSDVISLSYWRESFQKEQYETAYEDVYFIPSKGDGRDKYLTFTELKQFDQVMGYIVLELTVKKYIPSTVFPALLVEESPQKSSDEFDYAIYKEGGLVLSQGSFTFDDNVALAYLQDVKESKNGLEVDNNHFYAMDISNDRTLLIESEIYRWNRIIANVSFFFIQSLAVIGLIYIVLRYTHRIYSSSLANRIQLYIGLSFLLPTLFISIAILNTLNQSYMEETDRDYQRTARNLAENLVSDIDLFTENLINRDQFTINLMQAASLVQTDLIVYDTDGKFLGTSRPEVFRNNLLSDRINPEALRFIKNQLGTAQVLDEQIGKLQFKTAYTGIYDYQEGDLLAILALPYYDAKNHLNDQQVQVFSNLIMFFSIVFIITIVLGNIGIQNLIVPIKSLAERLSKTNLMEQGSKPLEYNAGDEIGLLVSEYNLMLEKLEDSKQRLAQIQKETAWKEIARQVAHEIKNPLTPMRLKVQQLQREKDPASSECRMLNSLLTQIDSLSSIADSFSAFAKLPAPQNEAFDLSELVSDVVRLYQGNDYEIKKSIDRELRVYADPKLLSQILNNLLLNALQAMDKSERRIELSLKKSNDKVICSVKDNGRGIPEEIQHKIFTPYFSTKEKGSGIGLALARKGIEQANGTIWFETKEGEGTTFNFLLPLA